MRAALIALAVAFCISAACRSAAPPRSLHSHHEDFEKFTQLQQRWDAALHELDRERNEVRCRAIMGEKVKEGVEPPGTKFRPVFEQIYEECERLATEVPEALQFCLGARKPALPGDVDFGNRRGVETLYKTVRVAPDSESVERCLWKLWSGSEPEDSARYDYLRALSGMRDLPSGSLARGWARLAKTVWVHGIGAPDFASHDPKLALDALAALESDYADTNVAQHAQALRRRVEMLQAPAAAPALQLTDLDGRKLSLADPRDRCALLILWDPADPTSANVLAALQHTGELVDLFGVQVGGDEADVARLMRGCPLPVRTAIVAGRSDPLLRDWGVRALPASFLIDREGRLRAFDVFGEALRRSAKLLVQQEAESAGAR
jgi:hypothetical protein